MKLYGKIIEIDHESHMFWVSLEDKKGLRSSARIKFSDIKNPEDIVEGNTLVYNLNTGDLQLSHLRVWTKQDEENTKKRADSCISFLDALDQES